jgi:hypothetical protein
MRVTLKAINEQLQSLGSEAQFDKGRRLFLPYFWRSRQLAESDGSCAHAR